ncbi:organic cation/carnitine transporter 2-like [Aristolochia californica]|uniref:organic cation/carnitine transporter 2-like n=1 Tax=Aristolochia californica TaxID=171875 RepID=UPI0035D9E7CD
MADTSPLLLPPISTEWEGDGVKKVAVSLDDSIEQCIGGFGLAQLLQTVLVSFAWVFDAQQTFISVFSDQQPSWHCTDASDPACWSGTSPCELPMSSWAWDRPLQTSIVSEWHLTCESSLLASLPTSSFFVGCLLGGFLLATLADSCLGRKRMLLLSCFLMSLTGILTVFSPNIWVYSLLRFVSGFGRASIGTCTLVLSTELVGKRWRGEVGVIGFFSFTLGFLSLPLLAFLCSESSWRALYLWTSSPALCYCLLVYFLVYESPRWLFVRGRRDEAIGTLRKVAATNGHELNYTSSGVFPEEEPQNVNIYSAMKILWENRWSLRRLLAMMVVSFGVGLMYYAMPLAVETLSLNHYLSVTFNALAEFPAMLLTFFAIGRLNRRSMVLAFTLFSGATSIACGILEGRVGEMTKWVRIGLEVGSFFSACSAINVVMIYTLELFPTCVRNSVLSLVRQALVLGGVFGSVLVAVGRKEGGSLISFGVFGLAIGLCGLFVVSLPETRGAAFCDTMEEQEREESQAHDSAKA